MCHHRGEGIVVFYATPDPFCINTICLKQHTCSIEAIELAQSSPARSKHAAPNSKRKCPVAEPSGPWDIRSGSSSAIVLALATAVSTTCEQHKPISTVLLHPKVKHILWETLSYCSIITSILSTDIQHHEKHLSSLHYQINI